MAVVLGIDDRGRFSGQPRQILRYRYAADVELASRKVLSVTGVASLPARIRSRAELIDLLMDRLEEMLRLEEVGHAIKRFVVDQDCAEQRLFRLDVMRGRAKGGGRFFGRFRAANQRVP